MIRGVIFDGGACPPCQHPWPVIVNDQKVGQVTTATWSPRFQNNVALAMINTGYWNTGTRVAVESSDGIMRQGQVVDTPMKGSA